MIGNFDQCIYLDYHATTPIDPAVRSIMLPLLEEAYGNPHAEHTPGWQAADLIDHAQRQVANLIGAAPDEIVFTSGATEANNHALQGILRAISGRKAHVVTSAIEHKSILQTLAAMRDENVEIDVVPISKDGRIDPDQVAACLRDDTVLVSIGMANNEIGTIQPISKLAAMCRDRSITFHTDAAQAIGKIPVDVMANNIDLLSLSGHKIYGPKGIGALYISRHAPIKPKPLILGGAQQNGMRAGTVPTSLCAGLGEACRIASQRIHTDADHVAQLRSHFLKRLRRSIPGIKINGSMNHRLPGNLNIQLPNVDADALLVMLQDKVAVSTGSACNAGLIEPSHVLSAIGLSPEAANSSIRIGIGRLTTAAEIHKAADIIAEKATNLRRISTYT